MVKEFGQFLEEVTKEFLELVGEFDIVTQDYLIEYQKTIKLFGKNIPKTHPSDIDIIGIKGEELWIIECQEYLCEGDNEKLNEKFKYAIESLNFSKKYKIKRGIACCQRHIRFEIDHYDKIFYFKEMLILMNETMKKIILEYDSWLSYGRLEWLLKWMNYTKILSPESKILLDEKEYPKHFGNTEVWISESFS